MGFISKIKEKYNHKKEVDLWRPISNKLRYLYSKHNACCDYVDSWGEPTRKELLLRYTNDEGLKFSIEKNIPTVSFMDRYFKGRCEDMGVYINDETVKSVNQRTVVMNGNCNGYIDINNCSIAFHQVHVRHNSIANVTASNGAYVWVKVYSNHAHVKCTATGNSRIVVFYMNESGTKTIFKNNVIESNSPYTI